MSQYTTVLGDTMQSIAEKHGHSGQGRALREANPELQVEGDTPRSGVTIELPADWSGDDSPSATAPQPTAEELARFRWWEDMHPA